MDWRNVAAVGVALVMIGSLISCGSGEEGGQNPSTGTAGAVGAAATLTWDQVVDPAVQGYKLYYGTQSRFSTQPEAYVQSVNVGEDTSYTLTNLQPGVTYYFAVTSYDAEGVESIYSEEVSTMTL